MSEIDVLYILGKGSFFGNEELRYSLRSLEKFGKNFGRLFITGECPDFINKEKVNFMPELDIGCPSINHWWKVDQTFRKTNIGDRALLMYDDVFFCAPVDLSKYPWRWRDVLPDTPQTGDYRKSLYNAEKWLHDRSYPILNFCMHQPCIYEKEKFLSMEKDFEGLKLSDTGMSVRCVYANQFVFEDEHQDDLKIRSFVNNLDELITGRDCFSIADDCFHGPVENWLKKRLPERSQWEND